MALPEYPFIDVEDYLLLDRHSEENYGGMKLSGTQNLRDRKDGYTM